MSLSQREFGRHLARSAVEGHGNRIARLVVVHDLRNILRTGHPVFVNRYDQIAAQINRRIAQVGLLIAAPQSSMLCCASRE